MIIEFSSAKKVSLEKMSHSLLVVINVKKKKREKPKQILHFPPSIIYS
jgi:hypothetical protein